MTKERLKSPRVRLFVALDLPEAVRAGLEHWRKAAFGDRPELRFPAAGTLHATLAFLGYQAERDVQRVEAAAFGGEEVARVGRIPLRIERLEPLPARRPRLYALSLEDPGDGLGRVQAELSQRLAARRLYVPEERPFWPHVTVVRVKKGREREAAKATLPELPQALLEPFHGVRLTLYRSIVKRQGAEYTPLAQLDFDRD